MNGPEVITTSVQTSNTNIQLQQWIFERVQEYIIGRVLEITEGEGIIAPICAQLGIHVEVKNIDLTDEDFKEKYDALTGIYDALIVLHAGEQIKSDRSRVINTALLLKQGGHLITRLPARTALYNGLTRGFSHWKLNNLEYIDKVLRKDFSIVKTRYFIVGNNLTSPQWKNKYSERVTIFNRENSMEFKETGLSIIIVGQNR